jgi:hypothetical protein
MTLRFRGQWLRKVSFNIRPLVTIIRYCCHLGPLTNILSLGLTALSLGLTALNKNEQHTVTVHIALIWQPHEAELHEL